MKGKHKKNAFFYISVKKEKPRNRNAHSEWRRECLRRFFLFKLLRGEERKRFAKKKKMKKKGKKRRKE